MTFHPAMFRTPTALAPGFGVADNATITAVNGVLSAVQMQVGELSDAGILSLSDREELARSRVPLSTSQAAKIALWRSVQAGERAASGSLVLTLADNDKLLSATPSSGSALTADGTLTNGFVCGILNTSATYALVYGSGVSDPVSHLSSLQTRTMALVYMVNNAVLVIPLARVTP